MKKSLPIYNELKWIQKRVLKFQILRLSSKAKKFHKDNWPSSQNLKTHAERFVHIFLDKETASEWKLVLAIVYQIFDR